MRSSSTTTRDVWDDFTDALDEVRRGGPDAGFWVGVAVALYWRWAALAKGDAPA